MMIQARPGVLQHEATSKLEGLPRYSWTQISKHNRKRDCWIVVDDVVYDVTLWVDRHPGGDIICSMAGEDVTALFHSSHFRNVSGLLRSYRIGIVDEPGSNLNVLSPFFCTLKSRVYRHFADNNTDYRQTNLLRPQVLGSALVFLIAWAAVYLWAVYPLAIVMGLVSCAMVGSFAHEYCHSTLISDGNKPNAKSLACSIIWALVCPFMSEKHFQYEHLSHHKFPMNEKFDYEIAALKGVLRLTPSIPYKPLFRFQHYYAPFVYAFYITIQVVVGFTGSFFDKRTFSRDRSLWFHIYAVPWITVLFHVAIPIYVVGASWWLVCFVGYNAIWQFCTYIVAAVVHMTERDATESNDWSYVVCARSVNVLCGNPIYDWLSGGFNYQIEHHLLPTIAREHLPSIRHIVVETCAEYGLPYKEYRSFKEYYYDHLRYLRALGRDTLLDR
jgi:fatty acid desaturase